MRAPHVFAATSHVLLAVCAVADHLDRDWIREKETSTQPAAAPQLIDDDSLVFAHTLPRHSHPRAVTTITIKTSRNAGKPLREYVVHSNEHRPHQARRQLPPTDLGATRVRRRTVLNGLITSFGTPSS
jgi:hypothetical protein